MVGCLVGVDVHGRVGHEVQLRERLRVGQHRAVGVVASAMGIARQSSARCGSELPLAAQT